MSSPLTKVSDEFDGQRRTLYAATCKNCGDTYWVPKSRLKKQNSCSVSCDRAQRKNRVSYDCSACGNTFTRRKSDGSRNKTEHRFCSRHCKDEAQKLGGIRDIQPPHYNNGHVFSPKTYRKKALRHYGAKCMRCGYSHRRTMLDVHHRDGDRGNNHLDNLEVVCVWCHALDTREISVHAWNGSLKGVVAQ